jgi:hypothetical protein
MADAWYNVGALYDMCDQPEDAQQAYGKEYATYICIFIDAYVYTYIYIYIYIYTYEHINVYTFL